MLLSINADAKTSKGQKRRYLTGVCYLAPAKVSGYNVCPNASEGCKTACLYSAGRGAYENVKRARIQKTVSFFSDKNLWMTNLVESVRKVQVKAKNKKFRPAIRLNGTSDIPWEKVKINGQNIFELFPHIQFYDYTKNVDRMLAFLRGELAANYHLTFSRSESNQEEVKKVLEHGGNVAVVFAKPFASYLGKKVVDGDRDDLRFLDPKGVVVGLKAKGKAKKDKSGFVVN